MPDNTIEKSIWHGFQKMGLALRSMTFWNFHTFGNAYNSSLWADPWHVKLSEATKVSFPYTIVVHNKCFEPWRPQYRSKRPCKLWWWTVLWSKHRLQPPSITSFYCDQIDVRCVFTRDHISSCTYQLSLHKHTWWPGLSDEGGARAGLVIWGGFLKNYDL